MLEIIGNVKNYEWGKLGLESEVAKLATLNDSSFQAAETQTYSELWMSDHVSGCSTVKIGGEKLSAFISRDKKSNIGGHESLPFLLKVLSIRKALSIQVHPNKEEAEKLHAEFPDIYKDPNHKPELAIALTPFLALCGFRPYREIHELLTEYKPLGSLIGEDNVASLLTGGTEALKTCYSRLMLLQEKEIETCIKELKTIVQSDSKTEDAIASIFTRLDADFPNDIGILSIFFLNIIALAPGQAIYLGANVPHAYLDGDCVECMACSDNVVRAGLTPKFKDVPTLLRMLNYNEIPVTKCFFKPQVYCDDFEYTKVFIPEVKDFAVAKINVPSAVTSYKLFNRKFGSILLVLSGKAELKSDSSTIQVQRGSIIFIPASTGSDIAVKIETSDEDFIAYQAMYNDF